VDKFDASGTFEADEIIVSSSASGKIIAFSIDEGSVIAKDSVVGLVDPIDLTLQKEQVEASIDALGEKTVDVTQQVKLLQDQFSVQETQLNNLLHEKTRVENLLKQDAATPKQLDDMIFQIESLRKQMNVTQQQINVQRTNVVTQNRTVLSESKPMGKRVEQLQEQLNKTNIRNPINGTVLTKYAQAGEITTNGKHFIKSLTFPLLH
jgi:HlyD family secretion protein